MRRHLPSQNRFSPAPTRTIPTWEEKKMIDEKLLTLIQCPISGQTLQVLPDDALANLNEKIAQGLVRDASDQLVESALDQGLVTADGARLYPVRGGIPTLIADSSIELDRPE